MHDFFIRLKWIDEERGLVEVESCSLSEIHDLTDNIRRTKGLGYIHFYTSDEGKKLVLDSLPMTRDEAIFYRKYTVDISDRQKMRLI